MIILSFLISNSGSKKSISSSLKYLLAADDWFSLIEEKVVWFLIKFVFLRAVITAAVILVMTRVFFFFFERGVEEVEPLLLSILELADWKDTGDKEFPKLNGGKFFKLTNSRKSLFY